MLKDIRLKIQDGYEAKRIIEHALNIGYIVDLSKSYYITHAKYLLIDPNQSIKWCAKEIYITALNYEEISVKEFLNYRGE